AGAALAPRLRRRVTAGADRLDGLVRRLRPERAVRDQAEARAELAALSARLDAAAIRGRGRAADRLAATARMLEGLGYRATLARGFAVVRSGEGTVLSDRATAAGAPSLEIEFRDGRLPARPDGAPPGPKRARKVPKKDGGQGSLF
ncbi:MAG: exodeoxyribonuclease VII large subunit, partial [Pseudomonadota bacterium]